MKKEKTIKLKMGIFRKLFFIFFLFFSFFIGCIPVTFADGVTTYLRVGVNPHLPPFQFLEGESLVGLHVDLLNEIGRQKNYVLEYIIYEDDISCKKALIEGDIDVILGLFHEFSGESGLKNTENLSLSSICMVTHKSNIDKMKDRYARLITTFQSGTFNYDFIRKMPTYRGIVSSDQVSALDLLISKKANILIGVKDSIIFQLENRKLAEDYVIFNNFMIPIEFSMAIKSADVDLLEKLNGTIRKMRVDGSYSRIYEKWIYEKEHTLKKNLRKLLIGLLLILTLIVGVTLNNLRTNRILKREVDKKTRALSLINAALQKQVVRTRNNNEVKNCIVENSPFGIVVCDCNLMIISANLSARRMIGFDYALIGQSVQNVDFLSQIFSKKGIEKLSQMVPQLTQDKISLKSKKGQINTIVRYGIYPLYNLQKQVRGAILTFDDITEQTKLKEEIFEREKHRALNTMIAGIAHEIRNPLTSIKTFVEILPQKKDNAIFQKYMAELIPKEVDRINVLIKNLIDYARPQEAEKEDVSFQDVIDTSTGLIVNVIEEKGISLKLKLEKDLFIKGNRNQLEQVLINLLFNGIDALEWTPKNMRTMEVKLFEKENRIFLIVRDNGRGMTQNQIRSCFDPFYTEKSHGSGLGLYLSKLYMEKHEGNILIESVQGKYTCVQLVFKKGIKT